MLEEDYLVNQIDQTWSIQCPEDSSIEVNEKGRSPLWNLICVFHRPRTMPDTDRQLSGVMHLMSQEESCLWRLLIINLITYQ